MTRSRRSARTAGTRFESSIAAALAQALDDDRIERRSRNGNRDRGDIGGVRCRGQRVVIEAKDCSASRATSLMGFGVFGDSDSSVTSSTLSRVLLLYPVPSAATSRVLRRG